MPKYIKVALGALTAILALLVGHAASKYNNTKPQPANVAETTTLTIAPPTTPDNIPTTVLKLPPAKTTPTTTSPPEPDTYTIEYTIYHWFDLSVTIMNADGTWPTPTEVEVADPQGGINTRYTTQTTTQTLPRQLGIAAKPYLDNHIRCEIRINGKLVAAQQQDHTSQPIQCKASAN